MTLAVYRDYDGSHRIDGYHELRFTTESDAREAAALAERHCREMVSRAMAQESRYRRAAERPKETT